jgi:hypothetical protein
MRPEVLCRHLMIVCVLGLAGCRNSTTSPNTTPSSYTNSGSSAVANANSGATQGPGGQGAPESSATDAPPPKPIVVRAGKEIIVTADQMLSSKDNNSGDHFDASLAEPIVVGDRVVIPKGAKVTGTVTEAKDAGRFKGNASLTVTLSTVMIKGTQYEIKTTEVTESGKGRGKRTAEGAGGGAVVGALIGALAGGGKGAAIGAGAGAGAGTAGTALTGNRDITIEPETRLHFKLRDPLEVREN